MTGTTMIGGRFAYSPNLALSFTPPCWLVAAQRAWVRIAQSESFRTLMPIPQTQLIANPLLVQNPGY
jgi:hypothetical protein